MPGFRLSEQLQVYIQHTLRGAMYPKHAEERKLSTCTIFFFSTTTAVTLDYGKLRYSRIKLAWKVSIAKVIPEYLSSFGGKND